jgi:hypothetical protein
MYLGSNLYIFQLRQEEIGVIRKEEFVEEFNARKVVKQLHQISILYGSVSLSFFVVFIMSTP